MTKKSRLNLLICESKLWLKMPELTDTERLRRIGHNLDEMQRLLQVPQKQFVVFGEYDEKMR